MSDVASQEWFAIKLAKIRDMMHNDLRYAKSEVEIDSILKEAGVHFRDVKLAIYEISDLLPTEANGLVNRMVDSEAERQVFFRQHGIMSEFDCTCRQMSASA